MNPLLELAERVAAAMGPDRELFETAYAAIHGCSWAVAAYRRGSLGTETNADKQQRKRTKP